MSDEQTQVDDPLAPPPPVAPEVKKTARKAKPQPKAKTGKFRATSIPFYHPYQKVRIPTSHHVPLEVDNWVEVQVAAGVLEEAKD